MKNNKKTNYIYRELVMISLLLIIVLIFVNQYNHSDEPETNSEVVKGEVINRNNTITIKIGEQMNDKVEILTNNDLENVTDLRINLEENSNIDMSILEKTKNLKSLRILGEFNETSYFDDLTQLEILSITNSKLEHVDFLENIRSLNELHLTDNNISSIEGLRSLTSLTTLRMVGNNVTDLEPIKELDSLTTLDLRRNQVKSLEHLQNLTSIKTLYLSHNPITNTKALKHLTNLEYLFLDNIQTVESLDFATEMNKLEHLVMNNSGLGNVSGLSELAFLRYLDILNTDVTTVDPLTSLDKLEFIRLNKDKVTDWEVLEEKEGIQISEEKSIAY